MISQTPEERDRLLALGKDGMVVCVDRNTDEGRDAEKDLLALSEDVRTAVRLYGEQAGDGFLLTIHHPAAGDRVIAGVCARSYIRQTVKLFHDRAVSLGGDNFAFAIIPPDETIASYVAEAKFVAGSA